MSGAATGIVPLLACGVLLPEGRLPEAPVLRAADGAPGPDGGFAVTPLLNRALVEPRPDGPVEIAAPGMAPVTIRPGGWSGRVDRVRGGRITGRARDDRAPGRPVTVLVVDSGGTIARGVARDGRFSIDLPAAAARAPVRRRVLVGIAGSDFVLDGGRLEIGGGARALPAPAWRRRHGAAGPVLRIKIAAPDLREAPMWGDFHFANSLAAAFGRLGRVAQVDTLDSWYARTVPQDAVLTIRGRQRLNLDRGQTNVMWLISHPDRITDDEYAEYDHVAVASDLYAERLRARGLTRVSVLHQATDAGLFGTVPTGGARRPAALFVGNSRREYRTMVRWCVERGVPLDLYGGGWEGILPPDRVRGLSVSNAELPALYARHALLLNDHWDTMRANGFLSNRLFDGSAAGTPILTDPVEGLEAVFGDTIATASDAAGFAARVRDCLENPAPWLARASRARETVLAHHTFDHRARALIAIFDRPR